MKKITLLLFLAIILVTVSCKKDTTPGGNQVAGTPSLTTADATLVTSISAQLGGAVTAIGSCPVSVRGVAIGTSHDPTISGTFYPEDPFTEAQAFTLPVGSLTPNTTYYVRAFAINCKGVNYGSEKQFTTGGGGGGGNDTAYFKLTVGGVTYFSYDMFDPVLASTVFPEGDTRAAFATWDSSNQVFSVTSQSSILLDPAKSFGYSFSYMNPDVNSTGTYSFGKFPAANKTILVTIRTGTGPALSWSTPGYNSYENYGNYTRHKVNDNCEEVETTSAVNTLIISRWGNPGQLIEGNIQGTVYENIKGSYNCQNSIAMPFSVEFKLKRLQ
ncbi:MAG: hypothetical protein WCK09_17120 [Bacteroidota bacterium]